MIETVPFVPVGYASYDNVCPICGKTFSIPDKTCYVYKRVLKNKAGNSRTVYVHTWSCLCRLDERIKKKQGLEFVEDL